MGRGFVFQVTGSQDSCGHRKHGPNDSYLASLATDSNQHLLMLHSLYPLLSMVVSFPRNTSLDLRTDRTRGVSLGIDDIALVEMRKDQHILSVSVQVYLVSHSSQTVVILSPPSCVKCLSLCRRTSSPWLQHSPVRQWQSRPTCSIWHRTILPRSTR